MQQGNLIDISSNTILRAVLIGLAIIFIFLLRDIIFTVFFAIIISSAVGSFADWMEKYRLPRILSVLFIYIVFFGLFALFLSLIVPALSNEVDQMTQFLPEFLDRLAQTVESAQSGTGSLYFSIIRNGILGFVQDISNFLQLSSESFSDVLKTVFGSLISLIAVVVISFYFAVMPEGVSTFFRSFLPSRYESYVLGLWRKSERKVGRWLQGQILLAFAVGLLVYVGLSILGVKYAILLAVIAMLLEVVPMIGPVIAGVPALIFAYIQEPILALWVLILYVAVQQLENHILTPVIMGKSVGLHPVTVLIALLIGGKVGILGIIIAVPVAVVIVEIWEDLAEQRQQRQALRSGA